MSEEEYRNIINDIKTSLETVKESRKDWNASEILQILALDLEVSKELYRLDNK